MALESPGRSATGSKSLGDSPDHSTDSGPAHTVSRHPPAPYQGPVPFSPYSQLLPAPLLSAHSLSICIPSPPPFKAPHPHPPRLGDKRARLERVPRSFIPHHMGPKAKSSAKRLNQVCRTKCYELTLWVYNFMPFVAICLSKQPPFHTDIQIHTFPLAPLSNRQDLPTPNQSQRSGTRRHVPRSWRTEGSRVLGHQKELGAKDPRELRG